MPVIKLIADSGSTKTEWCLLKGSRKTPFLTQGLSPYFVSPRDFTNILSENVKPLVKKYEELEIFFYGTGCKDRKNAKWVERCFQQVFPGCAVTVKSDLFGAARSLCATDKGIACILGTGSNSCYFNGSRIVKNSPGLGYVLGDEGSGAYLGKKVVQYYLYDFFDDDLRTRFDARFVTNSSEILHGVYSEPLPNRFLASFAIFLVENRGHEMIEEIIYQGLNDFFTTHVNRYKQSKKVPVHFTGSIAFGFQDVVRKLCDAYGLRPGTILKNPMEGLIKVHK